MRYGGGGGGRERVAQKAPRPAAPLLPGCLTLGKPLNLGVPLWETGVM